MLLAGDYVRWYGVVTDAIVKLSKPEQERIMGGTAAEAYGLV
jgi:predicted TIM-barrel fold metal-dependent hydrolase